MTAGSRSISWPRAFQDAGPEVLNVHGPRVTVLVEMLKDDLSIHILNAFK